MKKPNNALEDSSSGKIDLKQRDLDSARTIRPIQFTNLNSHIFYILKVFGQCMVHTRLLEGDN